MSNHAELVHLRDASVQARRARPDVPLALATLVAVDGSSYRQPGARMLCDAEGRVLAGAISGGCLESDVAQRAASVCASGVGSLVSYDLREDLETIWGFGTGCDGVAHIMLAPWRDGAAFDDALRSAQARELGVLLTVVASADERRIGEASFEGARAASGARARVAETPDARSRTSGFDGLRDRVLHAVQRTGAAFLGTNESGVRVFGAPVHPPVHVVVVGASRGAEAFAQATASAGWLVTVVDHRDDALTALTLPTDASRRTVLAEHVAGALAENRCVSDSRTCFALCTHRFDHDLAWLRSLIPTRVPYIGLLGSRQRAARLLRALTESGTILRARDRARVYAPIGLDIGGDSPQAIALAAIAEMHTVLHSRPGGPLRERQAPLHTRSATPSIATDIAMQSCPLPTTPPIPHSRERR